MPIFIHDPEDLSPEDIVEELGVLLRYRYEEAETELLRIAAIRADHILVLEDEAAREKQALMQRLNIERASALRELTTAAERVVAELRDENLAESLIRYAADHGSMTIANLLRERTGYRGPFTGSAMNAVTALTLDLHNRLEVLNQRILRFPRDVYQATIAETAPMKILGVETGLQNQRRAVDRFLQQGITGFTDRANRNWRIGSYAEMAGRTASHRAWQEAGIFRMQQVGLGLVTPRVGNDGCEPCHAWSGKVLSTDGRPAGVDTERNRIDEGTVQVTVDATIQEARNAGFQHPNCRCQALPYIPGVTTLYPSKYDPEAEKARMKQRELERQIRAAKRDAATTTDPAKRAQALREVKEAQAEMRGHLRATGRSRDSYREQLHFADGKTVVPRSSTVTTLLPPVAEADRPRQIVPDGLRLERHELATGDRLSTVGLQVRWRETDFSRGAKNPDATISGDVWEIKSPQGSGASTISNQLRRAKEQGAHRVVIDSARTELDDAVVLAELTRRFVQNPWWLGMIHIARDGNVTRLWRRK